MHLHCKSVFPESVKFINEKYFFEFPLLAPPLSLEVASQHAKVFVQSVYEAINELHNGFNRAHVDAIVLIDLPLLQS